MQIPLSTILYDCSHMYIILTCFYIYSYIQSFLSVSIVNSILLQILYFLFPAIQLLFYSILFYMASYAVLSVDNSIDCASYQLQFDYAPIMSTLSAFLRTVSLKPLSQLSRFDLRLKITKA